MQLDVINYSQLFYSEFHIIFIGSFYEYLFLHIEHSLFLEL